MNPTDVGTWSGDGAWSLPLIVLRVVIHVCGLALIAERGVGVMSVSQDRRSFMPTFAAVMGGTALLATFLHGIEAAIWAAAYSFGRAARQPVSDALLAQRDDDLRSRESVSEDSMAVDGCFGGTEWNAVIRADHSFSLRHHPEGMACLWRIPIHAAIGV